VPDDNATVRRLFPTPDPEPLSDQAILDAYPADRPVLRVNFVSSVDGAVTLDGRSGGLGDAADRRVFGLLRVACDAVLVGAGTVRIEQYGAMVLPRRLQTLRVAQGRDESPVLIVVSHSLDLDPAHPLFTEAPHRPVLITTTPTAHREGARFEAVADVLAAGEGAVDLGAAMAELARRGLTQILSEGGPHLLGSLAAADLVDELCLTIAPMLVGSGPGRIVTGMPSPVRNMALAHVLAAGHELLLRYVRPVT
jgi:riboflavin-specific deaminase-like protein